MSTDVVIPQPGKITLIVKGLVVIFINSAGECLLGMVREAPPDHNLQVKIESAVSGPNPRYGDFATLEGGLADLVTLSIANVSQPGIQKHLPTEPIDRINDQGESASFKWIVDIENELYAGRGIGASTDDFRTFFKFNTGLISTKTRSRGSLEVRRARESQFMPFGKTAVEVNVDISLDQQNSIATLTNGGSMVFSSGPGTSYRITIDRGDSHEHHDTTFDGDYYFPAIGKNLNLSRERMFFKAKPMMASATPDAACFVTYLSQSQPS